MIRPQVPDDHSPTDAAGRAFDVIVLGAGAVGENVVSKPRAAGMSVAVVEPELVGGECSYWACMPSKGLLRPVQVLAEATRIGDAIAGVHAGTLLDVAKVLARRDEFNSHLDDSGQVSWVESTGTTLIRGTARLAGERTVEVTGRDGSTVTLTANVAVAVCTGSTAAVPPPLADCQPWTNREGTSARAVPASLVVVGGGPVGCELAQAWHRLGAEVDLVNDTDRLLSNLEPEAGQRLAAALEAEGITVHLGSKIVASRIEGRAKVVVLDDGSELRADEVLVGAGRVPSTTGIGLESVGLSGGGPIDTDDTTTVVGVRDGNGVPWLYACGDCTTRPKLTHMGKYAARICGEVIARRHGGASVADPAPYTRVATTADHHAVPAVVFTDPEVASVGLSEAQAADAGVPVRGITYELGQVAGAALYADGYDGWAKIVVDTDRNVIVGATFVGLGVAELLHAATIAVVAEVPLDRLWHAVPSYPTVSEIWLRLLETAGY